MKSENDVSILVVDDIDELRELLANVLAESGFSVSKASGGREAFEIFLDRPFQLVITDLDMPTGSGLELLNKIKAHAPGFPVILVTENREELDVQYHGADAVFEKPYPQEALLEVVREILKE